MYSEKLGSEFRCNLWMGRFLTKKFLEASKWRIPLLLASRNSSDPSLSSFHNTGVRGKKTISIADWFLFTWFSNKETLRKEGSKLPPINFEQFQALNPIPTRQGYFLSPWYYIGRKHDRNIKLSVVLFWQMQRLYKTQGICKTSGCKKFFIFIFLNFFLQTGLRFLNAKY